VKPLASWPSPAKPATAGWLLAYGLFLIHALASQEGFLVLDYVNLPFHEAGHVIFGLLGETLGLWGGTLGQLAIPLIVGVAFCRQAHLLGANFALFWFGENFLNIGRYMADARAQQLPLVGGGLHDWHLILSQLGMLHLDTLLGGVTRALGWLLMFAAAGWLGVRLIRRRDPEPRPSHRAAGGEG